VLWLRHVLGAARPALGLPGLPRPVIVARPCQEVRRVANFLGHLVMSRDKTRQAGSAEGYACSASYGGEEAAQTDRR